jgi:tricorn protease
VPAFGQGTRLLRHPTVSRDQIAFEYAGDLWLVSRSGGQARRITSTQGLEIEPYFSPDGTQIAFSATVAGNTDVYVVPTSGGNPKRLTYHPGSDRVRGWTPDGRRVVFASARISAPQQAYVKLWTIGLDGAGLPEQIPMPRAFSGSYAPDGRRFAYEEIQTAFIPDWYENSMWRHYRGGRTHPISVMNLADYSVEKLPWNNSNDTEPMWIGNTIYFLSDRNHTVNSSLSHRHETANTTDAARRLRHHGRLQPARMQSSTNKPATSISSMRKAESRRELNIEATGDLPWTRPQFKKVASMIRNYTLSATGVRAAFEARGEIFTVPTEKGDYRNLTQSTGCARSVACLGLLMAPNWRGSRMRVVNTNCDWRSVGFHGPRAPLICQPPILFIADLVARRQADTPQTTTETCGPSSCDCKVHEARHRVISRSG